MRLKVFTAATVAEARDLAHADLGADAIVVSAQEPAGGQAARVTAAVDDDPDLDLGPAEAETWAAPDMVDGVRQTLAFHGVPEGTARRLLAAAAAAGGPDPVAVLAAALDRVLAFAPLAGATAGGTLMLVGPPGAGKTLATAKLARRRRARPAGPCARPVSADTGTGDGARLAALLRPWDLAPVQAAADADALAAAAVAAAGTGTALFIDTPAANPYNARDATWPPLGRLIAAAGPSRSWSWPGGDAAVEAADHARAFAALGARRLLATRVDVARRLGSLLAAADAARLALAAVTGDADAGRAVTAIDAAALARLLLPDPAAAARPSHRTPSAEEAGSPRKSEAAS
ncbi:MAG: GTPase [Hyphomicrobiales bacterium]|nr:GTPase [Hyphomicrobiales bacterium]